jgi:cephalosporin hydroxylase
MSLSDMVDDSRTDKNTIHSYLPLYQKLFVGKKDTALHFLEIGISYGGSVQLWKKFFKKASIHCVDIDPVNYMNDDLKNDERIILYTSSDGYDFDFFKTNFLDKEIKFDIMLDDGPHTLDSMKTFIKLYSQIIKDDGILIIEDVQAWEWIDVLTEMVPEHLKRFIKTYDLRTNKGRYDDIVFTIDKSI